MNAFSAVVQQAALAPSSHNSQPWLIASEGDALTLRADRTRGLPVADPSGRELIISCGAALLNARLAESAPLIQLTLRIGYPEKDIPAPPRRCAANGNKRG